MTNSIPEFETDTNCFFIIGRVHLARREYGPAITALEHALELDAANAPARYQLGTALQEANRLQEAIETASDRLLAEVFNAAAEQYESHDEQRQIALQRAVLQPSREASGERHGAVVGALEQQACRQRCGDVQMQCVLLLQQPVHEYAAHDRRAAEIVDKAEELTYSFDYCCVGEHPLPPAKSPSSR